mmetsp:Transcript_93903/g.195898  ORF Transcript_93903/g.195898 Transcript_93903/m.195898 type:complete len:209 (-) Transcript_93903:764-1390(-)
MLLKIPPLLVPPANPPELTLGAGLEKRLPPPTPLKRPPPPPVPPDIPLLPPPIIDTELKRPPPDGAPEEEAAFANKPPWAGPEKADPIVPVPFEENRETPAKGLDVSGPCSSGAALGDAVVAAFGEALEVVLGEGVLGEALALGEFFGDDFALGEAFGEAVLVDCCGEPTAEAPLEEALGEALLPATSSLVSGPQFKVFMYSWKSSQS